MSKSNRTLHMSLIIVFSFLLLVCGYANQVMRRGCLSWECAPTRSFDVTDLGLPQDLFPDNVEYQSIRVSYTDNTIPVIKLGIQTIEWAHGDSYYSVSIYPTVQRSSDAYNSLKEHILSTPGGYKSLWATPDLSQSIYSADDFFVECGTLNNNRKNCLLIAQYQEFTVYFGTTIVDEMTTQDFQEIVKFIDQQMANLIYGK